MCIRDSLAAVAKSSLPTQPPTGSYPFGFFSWNITGISPGASAKITITYPGPPGNTYEKLVGGAWTSIPVKVSGNVATLTVTDGGVGDADKTVNGQISDPGGIGTLGLPPTSTTLSKTANVTSGVAPLAVMFTFIETNTGTATLNNISVSDNKCSPVTPPIVATLDPGKSAIFTCTSIMTANTTDTANATGTLPDGVKVANETSNPVTVTILKPHTTTLQQSKRSIIFEINALRSGIKDSSVLKNLHRAAVQVHESVLPHIWNPDGITLNDKHGNQAFDREAHAVNILERLIGAPTSDDNDMRDSDDKTIDKNLDTKTHKLPTGFAVKIQKIVGQLVGIDKLLAQNEIDLANAHLADLKSHHVSTDIINKVHTEIDKANDFTQKGQSDTSDKVHRAIFDYREAWKHAEGQWI